MDTTSPVLGCVFLCNRTHCEINSSVAGGLYARSDSHHPTQSTPGYIVFVVACTSFLTLIMATVTCLILLRLCRQIAGLGRGAAGSGEEGELPDMASATYRPRPSPRDTHCSRMAPSGFYAKIDSGEMENSCGVYVPPDFHNMVMILESEAESEGECECEYSQASEVLRLPPGSPRYVDHPKSLAQYENLPSDQARGSFRTQNRFSSRTSGARKPVVSGATLGAADSTDLAPQNQDRESLDIEIPLIDNYPRKGVRGSTVGERPASGVDYLVPQRADLGYLSPVSVESLDDGYLVPQSGDSGYLIPQPAECQVVYRPAVAHGSPRVSLRNVRSKSSGEVVRSTNRSAPSASPCAHNPLKRKQRCHSLVSGYVKKTHLQEAECLSHKTMESKETATTQRDIPCSKPSDRSGFHKIILLRKKKLTCSKEKPVPPKETSPSATCKQTKPSTRSGRDTSHRSQSEQMPEQLTARRNSPRLGPQSGQVTNERNRPNSEQREYNKDPSLSRATIVNSREPPNDLKPTVEKSWTQQKDACESPATSPPEQTETAELGPASEQTLCTKTSQTELKKGSWQVPRKTLTEHTAPYSQYSLRRASFHNRTSSRSLPMQERRSLPLFSTFKPDLLNENTEQKNTEEKLDAEKDTPKDSLKESIDTAADNPEKCSQYTSESADEPSSPTYMCMSGLGAPRVTSVLPDPARVDRSVVLKNATLPPSCLERVPRPAEGTVHSVPATPQSRRSLVRQPDVRSDGGGHTMRPTPSLRGPQTDHGARKAQSLPGTPRLSTRARTPDVQQEPEYANLSGDTTQHWRV